MIGCLYKETTANKCSSLTCLACSQHNCNSTDTYDYSQIDHIKQAMAMSYTSFLTQEDTSKCTSSTQQDLACPPATSPC